MAEWQEKVTQLFALAESTTAEGEKSNALMSALKIMMRNNVDFGGLMKRAPDAAAPTSTCARCRKTEKHAEEEIGRAKMRADIRVSDLLIRVQDLERDLEAEKTIRRALERSGTAMTRPAPEPAEGGGQPKPPMTQWVPLSSQYANTRCKICAEPIAIGDKIFWKRGEGVKCAPCVKQERKAR